MPDYPITLTMLSPVHVGSGDELTTNEYVVREEMIEGHAYHELYVIDLPAFVASLKESDRKDLIDAINKDATNWVRKFIDQHVDLARFTRYSCATSGELCDLYRASLDTDKGLLQVDLAARTGPNNTPYIPGSSLKGAIRTAVVSTRGLNHPDQRTLTTVSEKHGHKSSAEFEAIVLGYAKGSRAGDDGTGGGTRSVLNADPFRATRITDMTICPTDAMCIDRASVFKPDRRAGEPDPQQIQMFYESTFSQLDGETIEAHGTLTIDDRLFQRSAKGVRDWPFDFGVAGPIHVRELLDACRSFYERRMIEENKRFYQSTPGSTLAKNGAWLLAQFSTLQKNETIVRLGRFSHVECVTVDRFGLSDREKTRRTEPSRSYGNKTDRPKFGTTRTLLRGKLPFGWAKLAIDLP